MSRANTPALVGAIAYIDRDYPNLFLSDKLWQFEPRPDSDFSMRWLGYVLSSPAFRKTLSAIATGSSQSMKNISQEDIMGLEVAVPGFDEQCAIVQVLVVWDAAIEKTERLVVLKRLQHSYFANRYLTYPPGAVRTRLSCVTRESIARNGERFDREAIMAVTKISGLRPMREETIAAAIDRYKVVRPRAFAYNPMRLNIGSITMSSFDHDVLVSPDYVVFECDESKLLPGYLNHLRRTRAWASHFESAGSGGVRIRIYYDDLAAFAFWLPPVEEQQRIVRLLDAHVQEIETLERYLDALKRQKRGLMQKLLTGQWRIKVPEPDAP